MILQLIILILAGIGLGFLLRILAFILNPYDQVDQVEFVDDEEIVFPTTARNKFFFLLQEKLNQEIKAYEDVSRSLISLRINYYENRHTSYASSDSFIVQATRFIESDIALELFMKSNNSALLEAIFNDLADDLVRKFIYRVDERNEHIFVGLHITLPTIELKNLETSDLSSITVSFTTTFDELPKEVKE